MILFRIVVKVWVIFYDQGCILFFKQIKLNGGNYILVGGIVEQEEFVVEVFICESKEEVGIMLDKKYFKLVYVMYK